MKSIQRCSMLLGVLWHLSKVFIQVLWGVWRIGRLPGPRITFFGGARLSSRSRYFQQAHVLAHRLAHEHISILTGGGPGIMEAATRGALHTPDQIPHTLGIKLVGLDEEVVHGVPEQCFVSIDYLFARKYMLIYFSQAYVVFPGGIGTMDELTEVMTLMQTKQIPQRPIFLIDPVYWRSFLTWIEEARAQGLVVDWVANLITVTDDIDHVFHALKTRCSSFKECQ